MMKAVKALPKPLLVPVFPLSLLPPSAKAFSIPPLNFCFTNASSIVRNRFAHSGDAILQYCTTMTIQRYYPSISAGHAEFLRCAVVRNSTLFTLAKKYCHDEVESLRITGKHHGGTLFEAYIGAIHDEKGLDAAQTFLDGVLIPLIMAQYVNIPSQGRKKQKPQSVTEWMRLNRVDLNIID